MTLKSERVKFNVQCGLLNQLDGIERGDVKVIMATNKIESLDRSNPPGTIDHQIDSQCRMQTKRHIFGIYARMTMSGALTWKYYGER